jgi:Restriction endonuclease S subunits
MANAYGFAQQIKKDRVPDGYMTTEAGVLPVEWRAEKMSRLIRKLTQAAGEDIYETVSISAGKGFVNQAQKFGKELSGKQYEKYIVLHKGDFSYNKGNSTVYPQGCIYRLRDRESVAVPNVFESFSVEHGDPDYYEQLFISGFLNKQLYSKINRGVRENGLLNLTGDDFYSCSVPVPPLPEQQKIAEVLFQCDRVIELKRQRIVEEKKKKKWLIEKTLNSGQMVELRQCCIADGEYGLNAPARTYNPNLPQYIRITDIDADGKYQGRFPVSVDVQEWKKYELRVGDILFVRTGGTVGKAYRYSANDGKLVYAGFLIRFSVNCNVYDDRFIYYQFLTERYRNWVAIMSARSGQPGINAYEYGKYPLRIPATIEDQNRIADALSAVDNLIDQLGKELEQWENKKKSLMKLLLTGIVRFNFK